MKQFGGGLFGPGRAGTRALGMALMLALFAAGSAAAAPAGQVDLNTATLEELASLPGVGPARAQAILERRTQGGFAASEDLMEIPGIGAVLFERLGAHVVAGDEAGENLEGPRPRPAR